MLFLVDDDVPPITIDNPLAVSTVVHPRSKSLKNNPPLQIVLDTHSGEARMQGEA